MWLARFARALARWRANGNNSKSSAVSSPACFSFSSLGIESLIPTPSSAVSHIRAPEDYWSTGILEHWEETPPLQYSNIPLLHSSTLHSSTDSSSLPNPLFRFVWQTRHRKMISHK